MGNLFFISYSRQDAEFTQKLEASLRAAGVSTWVDKSRLEAGDVWPDSISKALESSTAVILIIPPNAVESEWVKKETIFAANKHKRLIPIYHMSRHKYSTII